MLDPDQASQAVGVAHETNGDHAKADISEMNSLNIVAGSSIRRDETVEIVLLRCEAWRAEVRA